MTLLAVQLVIFLFPLTYSPGPGNLFFAANGARFGFHGTLAANAGYHVATLVVTVLVGAGFGTVTRMAPEVFLVLKYAGSAYVLYLAWTLLRSGTVAHDERARPAGFLDGVVLLVLNPKAYLILSLLFSQFLDRDGGDSVGHVLLISVIFTLNNLVAFSLWAWLGDRSVALFRSERNATRLNACFAIVLAGVALWMLLG